MEQQVQQSDSVNLNRAVPSEGAKTALPEVVRIGLLSMQVCVPSEWTDEQATEFANAENPSGLQNGWQARKQGDEALAGCDARVKCEKREGCVHIMFDC